jgi:hypothetical protein
MLPHARPRLGGVAAGNRGHDLFVFIDRFSRDRRVVAETKNVKMGVELLHRLPQRTVTRRGCDQIVERCVVPCENAVGKRLSITQITGHRLV